MFMKEFIVKKLIIWDFDGVVADTERLWLEVELDVINRYCGIGWDLATINEHLAGQAYSQQLEVLAKLGIFLPEQALQEIEIRCYDIIKNGFKRAEGIDEVLALPGYEHAIGTGGTAAETELKIKAVGLDKVFTADKVFTIDDVKYGKPAPDTFLLAAEVMGFEPRNCVVIEDSIAGLIAAKRAKMLPICFAGSLMYKANEQHLKKVKELGVEHIFFAMKEIRDFLATF